MSSYTTTPIVFSFSERGQEEVAEAAFDTIANQTATGTSASGAQYPPGLTKNPLDMIDTRNMIFVERDFTSSFTQTSENPIAKITLFYNARYASIVNAKYNWAGISPLWLPDFEQAIQPTISTETSGS
jgi:hypothetical protein